MSNVPARAWARWRVPLGYPLAVISLWLARPTWTSIFIGAGIACAGLAIRGAAAGHLRKSQALAQTGPYAHTRNPLYLGSAFLAAGFALASRSPIVALLLAAYFGAFYPMVMRREESELRSQYGEEFERYAVRVPLFWPRLGGDLDAEVRDEAQFSMAQYKRNREYRAAIGVFGLLAVLAGMAILRK